MKYYVVDVFTEQRYCGNPAGVCILERWLEDSLMQQIAFENNLAETAFLVKREKDYELRWFTPEVEIDLCGHATLGSAYVLMNYIDTSMWTVDFYTKSGVLTVTKSGDLFTMDFPSRKPVPCMKPEILEKALGVKVLETHSARDLLVVIESEQVLAKMKPDFHLLKSIDQYFGFIITARGEDCDFVSRFLAPNAGINEDSVTGSSHTSLIPYWSERLNKKLMTARQLSARGGELTLEVRGDRVAISGKAVTHLIGDIQI
ncbi:MAG: phenazine biosynthesis protein PhzF family [Herbinix sp.]|jgi:PhzF family phenazine biosynthesis protein|nr:phenazine biosynthesis protein PhzF family [Herbinix sp.]